MTGLDAELLFWPGSLGARGYAAVLEAAAAGGFPAAAISPLMIDESLHAGLDAASIRAAAEQRGVRLVQLDGVAAWAPIRYGAGLPEPLRPRFDFSAEQSLDLAEAVGMDSILAAGAFDAGSIPLDELADSFGVFCDAAAVRAMRVELEFVPFWGIPDLATAWQIVATADRPNGTLIIDSWHLLRGSAEPEAGLALLAEIPAHKLTGLQLADATLRAQADTLYGEGRFRRFPGEGELALSRLAGLMSEHGLVERVGPEVFGAAIDDLATAEAGRRAAESTRRVLRSAGSTR